MFRGLSTINVDAKGRLAIPARYREALALLGSPELVLTLNPWDRALWLYPLAEWELIETKLSALSDFDKQSRRTKQIMRGYAADCVCDSHGRVLLPQELRAIAGIDGQVALLGQGNKFEIWNGDLWNAERDRWLNDVGNSTGDPSSALGSLAL
ncbi:MAG: division/cell wall cluster transcriptional repressor MraZ [Gammaproteobacteria bacterium]|nr:division/cell wall cluster transcriptional repressor MraZ [Pseudomonadota bacterium]